MNNNIISTFELLLEQGILNFKDTKNSLTGIEKSTISNNKKFNELKKLNEFMYTT